MTLFSSSNLIIYISKLVSLFSVITVFTIINLSSLQADEQGSFEDLFILKISHSKRGSQKKQ